MMAALGFVITLSVMNVDALIVKHNVLRAERGRHFNVTHLAMLSTDAVPALVEEFQDATLSTEVHEGVGAALLCYYHSPTNQKPDHWQSYNYSQWRAMRELESVYSQLSEYRPMGKKWADSVRTPSEEVYLCFERW
jgi:hypothetical protein